ncbi:hypothetical protein [Chryseobacterium nepalense]|jgi:hypothetical protein|uniref:Restriction system protein Mrr-like N-terminal domain-containing protein n=1 Tax=Chryseobacterium nepalense TaxID=1854498 RepID=A0ABY4K5A8_9FLAO|nr:hypothetical protein [Chryseobacterium nepalense]UPQ75927.1 hypothetical protein M0D58_18015 [Chryseobacterium nepalense]
MKKENLKDWIIIALRNSGGKARLLQVCKFIWINYEKELLNSGDLFYTWQYDVRWAATKLRKEGILKSANEQKNGFWELIDTQS